MSNGDGPTSLVQNNVSDELNFVTCEQTLSHTVTGNN